MKFIIESFFIKFAVIFIAFFAANLTGNLAVEEILNMIFLISLALLIFRLSIFVLESGFFYGLFYSFKKLYQKKSKANHNEFHRIKKPSFLDSLIISSLFLIVLTLIHSLFYI